MRTVTGDKMLNDKEYTMSNFAVSLLKSGKQEGQYSVDELLGNNLD